VPSRFLRNSCDTSGDQQESLATHEEQRLSADSTAIACGILSATAHDLQPRQALSIFLGEASGARQEIALFRDARRQTGRNAVLRNGAVAIPGHLE